MESDNDITRIFTHVFEVYAYLKSAITIMTLTTIGSRFCNERVESRMKLLHSQAFVKFSIKIKIKGIVKV